MQALSLDYLERPTRKYIALAMLMCAVLLAAFILKIYAGLVQEKGRWEEERSQLAQEQKRADANARASDATPNATPELTRLAEVKRQLSVPWNSLFITLEAVSFEGVALLSMQPESGNQSLMLMAEAKDLPSMLEYARRLAREPMFANVQLTSHQIQQQDPQKPIRFVVQASWIAK